MLSRIVTAAERHTWLLQYTVPLLLDTITRRIVCNESALIIRDFNSAFDALARFPSCNLRPPHLADAIDTLNDAMCVPVSLPLLFCTLASAHLSQPALQVRLHQRWRLSLRLRTIPDCL